MRILGAPAHGARPVTAVQRNATMLYDVHVLVVDDNQDTLDIFSASLRQFGAIVFTARNAADALTIVKSARVDAIISDLAMPGNDGLWLVQQLRRLPRRQGGSIPAIAVTAYRDRYDSTRATEDGFEAFLSKPIDPFDLSRTLARLVGR